MDNPNNPNSSNPNPTSPLGGPLQTPPDLGNLPTSMPTPTQPQPTAEPSPTPSPPSFPPPVPSWPPASEPAIPFTELSPAPISPSWPQDTTQAMPVSTPTAPGSVGSDLTSAWTPPDPAQPEPAQSPTQEPTVSNPWSNPLPPMDAMSTRQTSTWTPPAPSEPEPIEQPQPQTPTQPEPDLPLTKPTPTQSEPVPPPSGTEPTPTFTPPAADPAGLASELPSATSPLDNPWGTTPANPTQPSWMMNTQTPGMPPPPTEAAPTDLSHLISNNQQESATAPAAESLVVPTAGVTPEVPNLQTETHRGIPKWLIGLGVGLLIIVVGTSAYFILGIGQPSKGTTSLPATTTPQTSQVKPPLPIATASAQPSPTTATSSANFGQIGGTPPATSAADLIRQRQAR